MTEPLATHAKKRQRHGWFRLEMLRPLDWLLLAVPAAFAIRYVPGWKNETLLFVITGIAIVPLAGWMGRAAERCQHAQADLDD